MQEKEAKMKQQTTPFAVAVVDVQAIINVSSEVRALKEEQAVRTQELNQWLQKAQNEVNTEQDKVKQQALLQKYNAEFTLKRREIAINYQEKLKVVCDNIEHTIAEEAKAKGYQLVLAKNVTIYGGTDITEDIAKIVK